MVIVKPGAYPTDLIDNVRIDYRDYLRRLTREHARRRREYGELADRLLGELEEATEPDPQEVADAVVRLVRTRPAGAPCARSWASRSPRWKKSTPCTNASRTRSSARWLRRPHRRATTDRGAMHTQQAAAPPAPGNVDGLKR